MFTLFGSYYTYFVVVNKTPMFTGTIKSNLMRWFIQKSVKIKMPKNKTKGTTKIIQNSKAQQDCVQIFKKTKNIIVML